MWEFRLGEFENSLSQISQTNLSSGPMVFGTRSIGGVGRFLALHRLKIIDCKIQVDFVMVLAIRK